MGRREAHVVQSGHRQGQGKSRDPSVPAIVA